MKKTLLYIFGLQVLIIIFAYTVYNSIKTQKETQKLQVEESEIIIPTSSHSGIIVESK